MQDNDHLIGAVACSDHDTRMNPTCSEAIPVGLAVPKCTFKVHAVLEADIDPLRRASVSAYIGLCVSYEIPVQKSCVQEGKPVSRSVHN